MTSESPPAPGSPMTSKLASNGRNSATADAHAVASSRRTRIEPLPVIIQWSATQSGTYPAPSPPSIGSNMNGSTYSDDVASYGTYSPSIGSNMKTYSDDVALYGSNFVPLSRGRLVHNRCPRFHKLASLLQAIAAAVRQPCRSTRAYAIRELHFEHLGYKASSGGG